LGVDWLVVALSVGSALAFAVSTTLKKALAAKVPDIRQSGRGGVSRFISATLRHPLWLGAVVTDVVGLVLQVIALHLGTLTIVQPLLVSGLLFALVLRHRGFWRISARELVWALLLVACLIGFLTASGAVSGRQLPSAADRLPAIIAALVGLVAATMCLILARRAVPAAGRAALIGVAVGTIYAATAALIKAATNVLTRHGLGALVISWQLYTVLVLGGAGLFLAQVAFQAGPLTASLPAMTTVDPLLSVAIGVLVYDEQLHRGPFSGALLMGLLLLLAASVIQLGRVEATEATQTQVLSN
jgi:drug/metabolite transporter (DMT)-like permease